MNIKEQAENRTRKMGTGEKEPKPHFGMVNFERRRHPRFVVDLPVEYWKINNCSSCPSRATNVCEGGLLLLLLEQLEIGQNLRLNLFVDVGNELISIEAVVKVVWKDMHVGKNAEYRTGVKFVDIVAENMDKLKVFLGSLASSKSPSELRASSKLSSIFTNFPKLKNHRQK
jgi:hypothetical protein